MPPDLYTTILTYLRASDLSSLQRTCTTFSNRDLIQDVITTFATKIYPPSLTRGYDTPAISGRVSSIHQAHGHGFGHARGNIEEERPSYETLRNMEMLIVARVLSRPEPSLNERTEGCFYVSKAWCKAALKWCDVHNAQRKERYKQQMEAAEATAAATQGASSSATRKGKHGKGKKERKKMKRQERMKNRGKISDMSPPWPNVNHDIVCEHGALKHGSNGNSNSNGAGGHSAVANEGGSITSPVDGSRSSRARRRLMDKQAWKVLKKLYPEGIQLSALQGECIQCAMEAEAKKRNGEMKKQKANEERRKPLENLHVRKFYSRSRGVPKECLTMPESEYENNNDVSMMAMLGKKRAKKCPLLYGIYYVLPRAWCHKWRKYIKSGEGSKPCAPETSACLCDAHRLPLIPPHLESFLYGESSSLLGTSFDLYNSSFRPFGANHDNGNDNEIEVQTQTSTPVSPAVASTSNNVVTIHDYMSPSPSISSSLPIPTSLASPRLLPVGYYPVDQQLGGRSRINNHSTEGRLRVNSQKNKSTAVHQRQNGSSNTSAIAISTSSQIQLDDEVISTLRASGLSEAEIKLQRFAMLQIEEEREKEQNRAEAEEVERRRFQQQQQQQETIIGTPQDQVNLNFSCMMSPEEVRTTLNAKLDYENRIVVEVLTEAEFTALEQSFPMHSSYVLKFAIIENSKSSTGSDIVWTTSPCRACDSSGCHSNHDFVVRNRSRNWVNSTPKKKKK